jgi:pimeloyl-ACP methyl ester carboxylesterase
LSAFVSWVVAVLVAGTALYVGYFVFATQRIAGQAVRLVPPAGSFVDVDGNRIHYVEAGQGRPIVFVHGLGAQLRQFTHPLFGRLEGDFRLVALDRPGSGYSVRARGAGAGVFEQAAVVVHFMEKLGLDRPLVVGHSLGGAVALAIAVEHPDAISGLALLAPYTRHSADAAAEFGPLYIDAPWRRWLIANSFAIPTALKTAPQVLQFVFGPQPVSADYMTAGGGYAGLRPGHFYATSSDIVAAAPDMARLEARYGAIRVPVGILFGTADRVLSYEAHGLAMQGRIAGLELELLNDVGHMPQFVAADQVATFIRRMAVKAFAD